MKNRSYLSAAFYQIDIKALIEDLRQIEIGERPQITTMSSWVERLYSYAQQTEQRSDPWRRVLERALPANVTSISTVSLLELLDVPPTTGNARRLARTMRSMGWVGLKSRQRISRHYNSRLVASYSRKEFKP